MTETLARPVVPAAEERARLKEGRTCSLSAISLPPKYVRTRRELRSMCTFDELLCRHPLDRAYHTRSIIWFAEDRNAVRIVSVDRVGKILSVVEWSFHQLHRF